MRSTVRLCFLLLSVGSSACSTTPADTVTLLPIGQSGGALGDTLEIVVVDEATGEQLAGATVTCGDASSTTALGSVVRCDATQLSEGLRVSAPGRVTERWIGISESRAVVALAAPRGVRTLHGEITGATDHATVSVSSELEILRSGELSGSSAECVDASDCTVALLASQSAAHDAVVLDHGAGQFVLVRDVPIDAEGAFAVDVRAGTATAALVELGTTTLPTGEGLVEVVGVPGLSSANGVALLGGLDATSTLVPAREGAVAGETIWFIAHGRTEDGSGEAFALDRAVSADGAISLPSTFLAVPTASRAGDVVTVTLVSGASLYVIESGDGTTVTERAIVFGATSAFDVPVSAAQVRVRAVEASDPSDLGLVAATATRFSDRTL